MNFYINFARTITASIAAVFITLFFVIIHPLFDGSPLLNIGMGLLFSSVFAISVFGLDFLFRRCHIKIFNTLVLGLFIGIFAGKAFCSIFDTLFGFAIQADSLPLALMAFPKICLYLLGIHLGVVITLAYQEELHISIPFVRFNEVLQGRKDIIIDESALADPRILDFLSTGILNDKLMLPSFLVKSLQERINSSEDHIASNIKKLLAIIDKLKSMKNLNLKENETDFNDLSDVKKKTLRLAKLTKSNLLVSDCSKIESEESDVEILSLSKITNSLKNVMTAGENIEIKVQRYGKEPKQGVGYLDDGTMVVINNGGNFIGEVIDTQVISVKQTSAGRIIFTNALVEDEEDDEYAYQPNSSYQHNHE